MDQSGSVPGTPPDASVRVAEAGDDVSSERVAQFDDDTHHNTAPIDAATLEKEARRAAAEVICRWWRSHMDRQTFVRIRDGLAQAEGAIASEVLRQICPVEAGHLEDSTLKPRVRFRLAGGSFPPRVVFKVYVCQGSTTVLYFSGRRMIKPDSEAAVDAARQMGRRQYTEQMERDWAHHRAVGTTDEVDVTSLQEYMQFAAATDNLSAGLGGRDNGWRYLQPEEQHGVLYDFINYCHDGKVTPRLQRHAPSLGDEIVDVRSADEEALAQSRAVEARRKLAAQPGMTSKLKGTERRRRLAHMRQLYGLQSSEKGKDGEAAVITHAKTAQHVETASSADAVGSGDLDDDEADSLFQWSQMLPDPDILAASLADL